ncbi:MAG TPA: hypothetical protein VGW10_00380 [Solirubrobacteraceae bacterium]|nr:hypothetical protein [Solirubrobacteraceae bacterium]
MTIAEVRARLDPELVFYFADEEDAAGDAPELHLDRLGPRDLVRCFDAIVEHGARWNDRTFYIEDEDVDVTVAERPEVAELVAAGRVHGPCIGAEGIAVDGVELPLVEMFLHEDEINFFWWPDAAWTDERVAAFFVLLVRLLDLAPAAVLLPDRRYSPEVRRELAAMFARVIGDAERVHHGESS